MIFHDISQQSMSVAKMHELLMSISVVSVYCNNKSNSYFAAITYVNINLC